MKVLIWDKGIPLQNTGGPSGYLYNIHEYLKEYNNDSVDFYSDVIGEVANNQNSATASKSIRQRMLSLLLKRKIPAYFIQLKHFYFTQKELSAKEKEMLSKYDYVHVHTMQSLVHYFLVQNVSAKIIFTTHCPEPCFDEVSASYGMSWFANHLPFFRGYFLKRECNIIRKANLVMFPVKEAIAPYVVKSKQYERLFSDIENRIFYVPTALYPADKIETSFNPVEKENIPQNSLKVCYIGRHNQIKGYDIVKEMAELVWKRVDETIHFIIGGKESPLYGLQDCRWHELGWVKTVEVLNNVDLFILPNRQTYFDLVLLEVLRQGKPCVISDTGGNRWFKQHNLKGISTFDVNNIETVIPIFKKMIDLKRQGGLYDLEQEITKFFSNHFTVKAYLETYLKALSDF